MADLFADQPLGQRAGDEDSTPVVIFFAGTDQHELFVVAKIEIADSDTYAHLVISGNRILIKDKESLTLWTVE